MTDYTNPHLTYLSNRNSESSQKQYQQSPQSQYSKKSYPKNVMVQQEQPGMFDYQRTNQSPTASEHLKKPTMPSYEAPQVPAYKAPAMPRYEAPQAPQFQQPAYQAHKELEVEYEQPEQYYEQAPQYEQVPRQSFTRPEAPVQPVTYQVPRYEVPKEPIQRTSFISRQSRQEPVYAEPEPVQYQQPVYEQPVYQQPVYQQPVQQPVFQQPVYQQPVYQQPVQQPVYQQPVYQQPVQYVEEPRYIEEPQYIQQEEVKAQYQEPQYQQPVYQKPQYVEQTPPVKIEKITPARRNEDPVVSNPAYFMEQPDTKKEVKAVQKTKTVLPEMKKAKVHQNAPKLVASPQKVEAPKMKKVQMTNQKLTTPKVEVKAPTVKAPVVKAPKVEVKAPKVEVKAPKVEAKKTLPKGYATIEAIEAKKVAAPPTEWSNKITTGPKKIVKKAPMGLQAPDQEVAPLEYPSSSEEEEQYVEEQYQEPSVQQYVEEPVYEQEQYYEEPVYEQDPVYQQRQHFISPKIYEAEPVYQPSPRQYKKKTPKMSQSPIRPAWNKSIKTPIVVEKPRFSPRKQVKTYDQAPKFSGAVAPYRPKQTYLKSPRKSPSRQSPSRQTWNRKSVSPDLNQGWKNQDFQDAGMSKRPMTGYEPKGFENKQYRINDQYENNGQYQR